MPFKKRHDITREVDSLKNKGLDAKQQALEIAKFAEKRKRAFDGLNKATTETSLIIDRSDLETKNLVDFKYYSEVEKVDDVYTQLGEYQSKFKMAISADNTDISQIDELRKQVSLEGIDPSALQQAQESKQQEIEFFSQVNHSIDRTQEQLKQHLAKSRQRSKKLHKEYKNKDLSPAIEQYLEFEDSFDNEPTAEYLNENLSDPNFPVTGFQIEQWQQLLTELSQSIVPFISKTVASVTIPFSMFTALIGSPSFIQMTKVGMNFLKSSVEIIADVYPNLIDLNNRTLGANWSTLSDESIFNIISDISEEHDKLHFGDEKVAEFVNDYTSAEEEKDRKRRRDRQLFDDASSSTDSSPKPPKEPSAFAKSLSYGHLYGKNEPISFEANDRGGTLQALLPDGTNSECYVNYSIDNSGRIKIGDIQVPPNLQRQGIATLLFKDLEERVPVGTTFFFVENQSPEFWAATGFQFNEQTGEYYKIKSDPISF